MPDYPRWVPVPFQDAGRSLNNFGWNNAPQRHEESSRNYTKRPVSGARAGKVFFGHAGPPPVNRTIAWLQEGTEKTVENIPGPPRKNLRCCDLPQSSLRGRPEFPSPSDAKKSPSTTVAFSKQLFPCRRLEEGRTAPPAWTEIGGRSDLCQRPRVLPPAICDKPLCRYYSIRYPARVPFPPRVCPGK